MNISDVITILEKLIIHPEENNVFVDKLYKWYHIFFGKEREYEIEIDEKINKILLKYNGNFIIDDITNVEKYKLLELYEKLHDACEDIVIANFNSFAFND